MSSGSGSWVERLARRLRSRRFLVQDHSMEPTFLPGDRLLALREKREGPPPTEGQVVVVRDPERPDRLLLKRVVAVRPARPGSGGGGGVELDLRGDAATSSRDSRDFGWVPAREVVGLVWYRYAPPERRGELPVEHGRMRP